MIQPRGFWGTFLFIAAITGLPFTLLWSAFFALFMGWDFGLVLRLGGIWAGLGFGLLFGFVMAFSLKAVTISRAYEDKATFLSRLNIILAELDYHPEFQSENFLSYKPSLYAGLLSGKISVQLHQNSATIVGPSTYIRKIEKRI